MKNISKKYGVCDLKYSKRLAELRVKQESLWWWVSVRGGEPELYLEKTLGMLECNSPHAYERICSAFTVAELGEMLPKNLWTTDVIYGDEQVGLKSKGHLTLRVMEGKEKSLWAIGYEALQSGKGNKPIFDEIFSDTEANARAKMVIYLLENKLIK